MKCESDKMQYISVLRVGSMLLIVLFHSMCFYTGNWWYLCADVVPFWKVISTPTVKIGLTTFVFISGFLYGYMYLKRGKYRNPKTFLAKKSRRLLVPYFFWGILMIITMPAVHISWINLFTGVAHLWFLMALFEMFVIMMLLNCLGINESSSKYVDFIVLLFSFVLLYVWKSSSGHQYAMAIKEMLYYLPAFLVGFYYAKYRRDDESKVVVASLFMVGIIVLFAYSLFGYPDDSALYRVPAILVSLSAMIWVSRYVSFYQSNVLCNLDNNSMGIYIFNQIVVFVLLLIPDMNLFLYYHTYFGTFIIFIVSLIIPWMLSILFNKMKHVSFLIG